MISLQDYLQDIVGQMNHSRDDDDLNESIASSTHHIQSDKEVLLPNFAEAALLLQNSSHVYSRKVEYLYSLVYSALDDLASSSTNAPNKQKSKRHVDDDIQDFESFDPQLQFLLLDDVLPTDESGDKINLKQPVNDNAFDADRTLPHQSMTRLSMGGMSTTKLDKSGIAPDTALRTLLGALHTQGSESSSGGTLRILSQNSDIGPDGGLHMPGTAILSQTRQSSFGLAPGTPTSVQAPTHDIDAENDDLDASDEMDRHDDDDNDDGVGFQMADDEPLEPPLPIPPPEPIVAPTRKDPWALLDPHKPDKKGRRLRVGKTHVLPNGIDETPSECVTGARTRRKPVVRRQVERPSVDGKPVSLAAATFKATMARERRKLSRVGLSSPGNDENDEDGGENIPVPNVPMTGLVFGEEFAYIAKAAAKRKAAERRERRKLLAQNPEAVPAEEANELMGYDDGAANFGYGNDDYGGGDDHAFDEPDVVSLEQVLAQNSGEWTVPLRNVSACLWNLTSFQQITTPTRMRQHLRRCVGHTSRHLPREPRGTKPKPILASGWAIGKVGCGRYWKPRKCGPSLTFIVTANTSLTK